mgnify:CR=1 FL=1|tara:strand:- start:4945 stop:5673 length:729 start_codon:yes stop_codon:yes gene_type:complete
MIVKEILQRVQSLYSKGVQSDDSRLSARHIYSKVLSTRARLITQRLDKRQKVSQWVYQTLDCVELIKALPYECPCLPPVGCTILRTKLELPKPLTGILNGHMIESVTSVEGSVTFSETTWKNKKYAVGSKYTSTKPDFYIRNNYLYITTKDSPKIISITGLFEDPLEATSFLGICGAEVCTGGTPEDNCPECASPLDLQLPIDKAMVETLIEVAANELINVFNQSQEDLTNNSTDTGKEQTK